MSARFLTCRCAPHSAVPLPWPLAVALQDSIQGGEVRPWGSSKQYSCICAQAQALSPACRPSLQQLVISVLLGQTQLCCTLGLSQTSFSPTLSGLVLSRPRKPGLKVRQRQKLPSQRLRFPKHLCEVLACALCNSRTDTNYTRTSHAAGVPPGERTTYVWPGVLPRT